MGEEMMIPKIKTLGLTALAVLAMSAFVASAAQAAPVFTASAGTGTAIHGTGESIGEKFTIDGVTTECKTSHYTGTVTNGSSTLTLNPTYTGCTFAGTGLSVHFKTNGCGYLLHLFSKFSTSYDATLDFECPAGQVIQIEGTGTSCEAAIGAQTGKESVHFTNSASDIVLRPSLNGTISWTSFTANVTKDGFLCPFNGTGTKTGGSFTSTGFITGTSAFGTIQVSGE